MKINCAIIVDSLEESKNCLVKFDQIKNKTIFTFDEKIKSLQLLKSKKNYFFELESYFNKDLFFILHPDEEIVLWDEEEAFKSHYNLIIDGWVVKVRRNNVLSPEVSKIFLKSNFKNVKRFDTDWNEMYSKNNVSVNKMEEYIFLNEIEPNELFLIYEYVLEKLKLNKYDSQLVDLIRSTMIKAPEFIELLNLWGDYLYEKNLYADAKKCYLQALETAKRRNVYDFLPMMPQMHQKHPDKMIKNIDKIISKYDFTLN